MDERDVDQSVKLIITGWGRVSKNSTCSSSCKNYHVSFCSLTFLSSHSDFDTSNALRKADLYTVPLPECNKIFAEFNKKANLKAFRDGLSDSQYCTYDPNGSGDSCEGDSGGPVQIVHQYATVAKIVAVVSFGSSCGSTLPSINTRVSYYLTWIESHVWPNNTITSTF